MRLRSVWISQYKNLRDFTIAFEGDGFIDIFVGKNGSGKSNFLEALIEIFDHIFAFDPDAAGPGFDYAISYEIAGVETATEWRKSVLAINGDAGRRTIGLTPLPDHILVYYSGHNPNVGALIDRYEDKFTSKIDGPGFADSPKILPVAGEIKDLLLAMMLLLPDNHPGRAALLQRLGIRVVKPEIRVVLQRPRYARGRSAAQFNVDDVVGDKYWKPRGPTKDFLDRLDACQSPTPQRGPIRTEGYQAQTDSYILFLDIERLRADFAGEGICSLFRQFYSLKVLDMLTSMSVEVELESGFTGGTAGFSDGQFQMVYMLATAELFKDRNVISLFDEPDAFLHPEWQFDFLRQVNAISDQAARTNHILINTHSASTIVADVPCRIRHLERRQGQIVAVDVEKAMLVQTLSAGLITFSEREASLNIEQLVANTSRPVLFTEGVSDAEILRIAWQKLNPSVECPFEIIQCFDCGHLRKQLNKQELYQAHPGRVFFGLFDFDKAYGEWARVGGVSADRVAQGNIEQADIKRGLVCKRNGQPGYAILLPVPAELSIRGQVYNVTTGQSFGENSRMTIEMLFRDVPGFEQYFSADQDHPARWQHFTADKVHFAQHIIPTLAAEHFEPFRPIFDFIISKAIAV